MGRTIPGYNFKSLRTGKEFDVPRLGHFGAVQKVGIPPDQQAQLHKLEADFFNDPITKFFAGTYKTAPPHVAKPKETPFTQFSGPNYLDKSFERKSRSAVSGAPSAWHIANQWQGGGKASSKYELRNVDGKQQGRLKTTTGERNPWQDVGIINNRVFEDLTYADNLKKAGGSRYVGKSIEDIKKSNPRWAAQLDTLTQASSGIYSAYRAKRSSGGVSKRIGGVIGPALTLAGIFTGNPAFKIAGAGVSGLNRGSRKLGVATAAQGTPAAATPDANVLGVSVGDLQSYNLKRVEGKQSKSGRLSNVLSKSTGSLV